MTMIVEELVTLLGVELSPGAKEKLQAFDKGLEYIAISDHGPGHLFYGVNRN